MVGEEWATVPPYHIGAFRNCCLDLIWVLIFLKHLSVTEKGTALY